MRIITDNIRHFIFVMSKWHIIHALKIPGKNRCDRAGTACNVIICIWMLAVAWGATLLIQLPVNTSGKTVEDGPHV